MVSSTTFCIHPAEWIGSTMLSLSEETQSIQMRNMLFICVFEISMVSERTWWLYYLCEWRNSLFVKMTPLSVQFIKKTSCLSVFSNVIWMQKWMIVSQENYLLNLLCIFYLHLNWSVSIYSAARNTYRSWALKYFFCCFFFFF